MLGVFGQKCLKMLFGWNISGTVVLLETPELLLSPTLSLRAAAARILVTNVALPIKMTHTLHYLEIGTPNFWSIEINKLVFITDSRNQRSFIVAKLQTKM